MKKRALLKRKRLQRQIVSAEDKYKKICEAIVRATKDYTRISNGSEVIIDNGQYAVGFAMRAVPAVVGINTYRERVITGMTLDNCRTIEQMKRMAEGMAEETFDYWVAEISPIFKEQLKEVFLQMGERFEAERIRNTHRLPKRCADEKVFDGRFEIDPKDLLNSYTPYTRCAQVNIRGGNKDV